MEATARLFLFDESGSIDCQFVIDVFKTTDFYDEAYTGDDWRHFFATRTTCG